MSLEAALNLREPRVAAWDSDALIVLAVGRDRAEVVAREQIPRADRHAIERQLEQHEIPMGATHAGCGFVWLFTDEFLAVVQIGVGIRLEALRSDLVIAGRRVRMREVVAVQSFVDRTEAGHRGVRVVLTNNDSVTFAEQRDATRTSPEDETWIALLGRGLAAQIGVPYRDEAGKESMPGRRGDPETDVLIQGLIDAYTHWDDPDRVARREAREAAVRVRDEAILDLAYIESGQRGELPMDVAVAKMAAHFAAKIEREIPDVGPFKEIHQALPEIDNGGYVAFDLKPAQSGRVLELRVESPSGEFKESEVLRTGSTAELVRYLRAAALPDHVLPVMRRLTDATRDGI